jgi:hypothetical protein
MAHACSVGVCVSPLHSLAPSLPGTPPHDHRCVRQWSGKGSDAGSVWSVEGDVEGGEGAAPRASAAVPSPSGGSAPPPPPGPGPADSPPLFDVKKAITLLMVGGPRACPLWHRAVDAVFVEVGGAGGEDGGAVACPVLAHVLGRVVRHIVKWGMAMQGWEQGVCCGPKLARAPCASGDARAGGGCPTLGPLSVVAQAAIQEDSQQGELAMTPQQQCLLDALAELFAVDGQYEKALSVYLDQVPHWVRPGEIGILWMFPESCGCRGCGGGEGC